MTNQKPKQTILNQLSALITQLGQQGAATIAVPLLSDYITNDYLPWAKLNKASYYDDGKICEVINAFFAGKRLDEITSRMVREFQVRRQETITQHGRQRKAATVNRELAFLSRIFSLAVECEVIESNPCAKVRSLTLEPNRIDYLLEEGEERLLSFCRDERAHLRDIVTVALNTGLRPGTVELLGLQMASIDFARNVIELTKHKTAKRTGQTRIIPLNSLVKETLLRLTQGKKAGDFVFTNPLTGAPSTEIKKGFKRACELAGIPKKKDYPYLLRHTFGTRLAEKGVKIPEIKELMGHTSLEMTMRYVHASARGKLQAVELLVNDAPPITEPLPAEEWISADELARRFKIKLETIYNYLTFRSRVSET
jgi:integrase